MRIVIKSEKDVIMAVQYTIDTTKEMGFTLTKQCMIATAVSELSRNIIIHAGKEGVLSILEIDKKKGIKVIAEDSGVGIIDISLALQDNYSTANSLGIGLSGTKRLMDDFTIKSTPKKGTKVIVKKWL